eukprot:90891-Prorocentrum_minimum.AAC.1
MEERSDALQWIPLRLNDDGVPVAPPGHSGSQSRAAEGDQDEEDASLERVCTATAKSRSIEHLGARTSEPDRPHFRFHHLQACTCTRTDTLHTFLAF